MLAHSSRSWGLNSYLSTALSNSRSAHARTFVCSAAASRRSTPSSSSASQRSSQTRKRPHFKPKERSLPPPESLNPLVPSTWEPQAAFTLKPHQNVDELVATYSIALSKPGNATIEALANVLGLETSALENLAARWKDQTGLIKSKSFDKSKLARTAAREGLLAIHQLVLQNFLAWSARSPSAPPAVQAVLQRLYDRTNFTKPESWRPLARRFHRKVILHVGPTNSGKTYQALAALARSRKGVYAGPLRLLAHEVFTRFNSGNIGGLTSPRPCNLITGEEQRRVIPTDEPGLLSCTVEMAPSDQMHDVVVIDEIQMIADRERGNAWTSAFLNVHAHELHLCGEERAVPLIERLAELTGDDVEVRRYTRLSGLEVSPKSLNGNLKKVERGDCIVTFSRNNIFAVKQAIEKATDLKVAVAYGGLPPEVREEQARIFNQEEGADVMVASDAIGMGLNLKIRRVIFESLHKFNGNFIVPLDLPQVKQIGGRAGRYGMHSTKTSESAADLDEGTPDQPAASTIGQVTTLDPEDLPLLRKAMNATVPPIPTAIIAPSTPLLVQLNAALAPNVPWSQVLAVAHIFARTSENYTIPIAASHIPVAAMIDEFTELTVDELQVFAQAPVNQRDVKAQEAFKNFVRAHMLSKPIDIGKWCQEQGIAHLLPESHRPEESLANIAQTSGSDLLTLESCHKIMSLYLWLSYRLPISFDQPDLVRTLRHNIEKAIESVLAGRTEWLRKKAKGTLNESQIYAQDLDNPSPSIESQSAG